MLYEVITMVLLTGLLFAVAALVSWNVELRPREARERDPGAERHEQEAGHRLEHHQDVGRRARRRDAAVADRGEGLHREEEVA